MIPKWRAALNVFFWVVCAYGESYFVWHDQEFKSRDEKACSIICAQHKCGTYNVLQAMDRYYNFIPAVPSDDIKMRSCRTGDVAFFLNILTMQNVVNFDYSAARGVLMIRHPLDVLVSSHRFHLTSGERWLHVVQDNGLTYQEELNTMDKSEGIMHELMKGPAGKDTRTLLDWIASPASKYLTRLKLEKSKYSPEEFSNDLSKILGLDRDRMRPIIVDELSYDNFQQFKHLSPVDKDLIDQIKQQNLHGADYPYEFSLHLECAHYKAYEQLFGMDSLQVLGYGDSIGMYKAAKRKQCKGELRGKQKVKKANRIRKKRRRSGDIL